MAAVKVVKRANNPDMAPFMLLGFDAIAGMSGNFLFLSASEPGSVLSMIFVDVIENMGIAIRVIFLIMHIKRPKMNVSGRKRSVSGRKRSGSGHKR